MLAVSGVPIFTHDTHTYDPDKIMGLARKITLQSVSTDGRSITIQDTTGAYNSSTNVGGYGTPNPAVGFFDRVLFKIAYLDGSLSWLATANAAGVLSGSNYQVTAFLATPPTNYPFKDGVALLSSYAGSALETVTGVSGAMSITGSLADFVSADSVIDANDNVYLIDQTQTNTSSIIYITPALMGDITQARACYTASCYVMVNAEFVCLLTSAVGSMAIACNEDNQSEILQDLLAKKFAADFEFSSANYISASNNIATGTWKLKMLYHG